ncbi:uncharacterized protein [Clytia hemisphaerica]|uniref:Uncharacterized protein n=1 Tax=Clytia hemisphaerica TaxID=252671 RepID=A0A7M5WUR0_9CNID
MSSTSTSHTELDASTCKDIPRRRRSRHRSRSTCSTDNKDTPVSFQQKSEHNFQTWNENLTIIPSVFRHDSEGIPIGTQDKGGQAALKGPQKEKDFLDKMKEFGVGKAAIVLHSLKFRELFEHYNKLLTKHSSIHKHHQLYTIEAFRKARHYAPEMKELSQEAEVDFLMLVKSKGFFLFEVKSSIGERYHAKEQLVIRRALMNVLIEDAIKEGKLGEWTYHDLPKYCASIFPSSQRPETFFDDEYFENDFSNPLEWLDWWMLLVDSKPDLQPETDILFSKIVSRIMYTVSDYMPLTLSEGIADIGDDIQQQKLLKTFGTVPRVTYDIDNNSEPKSTKLSNAQVAVLNGFRRQVIVGPTGSGKSLIIAAKALQLSSQKKNCLLICGFDCVGLKHWYIKMMGLNECYGHDHLEYVYVSTLKELLENKEVNPVEHYCLIDELDEIIEGQKGPLLVEFWNNVLRKPFAWMATDKESTLQRVLRDMVDFDSKDLFKVSLLSQVLRNTVSIFKEFSGRMDPTHRDLDIEVGHDVEGLPVDRSHVLNVEKMSQKVIEIIRVLTQKRTESSINIREMDYRDILVYVTADKEQKNRQVGEMLKMLNDSTIPVKTFRHFSGEGFSKKNEGTAIRQSVIGMEGK